MKRPEQKLQQGVARHLRSRGKPGLVWFHVPNQGRSGGPRGRVQGAILKSMGLRAGVSDFIMLNDGKFFALELKPEGERPTESQVQFLQDVNNAGGFAACAEGLDRALGCLETWGLLRGKGA